VIVSDLKRGFEQITIYPGPGFVGESINGCPIGILCISLPSELLKGVKVVNSDCK